MIPKIKKRYRCALCFLLAAAMIVPMVCVQGVCAAEPKQDPTENVALYKAAQAGGMEVYGASSEQRPSMDELLNKITVDTPSVQDDTLTVHIPAQEAEDNQYEISYNGTDFEQVVDKDLKIYQPVSDKKVKVSFKITDTTKETVRGEDPSKSQRNYAFKEIEVTVPGQNSKTDGDNPAPEILPELAEWKGRTGTFTAGEDAKIIIESNELKAMADAMAEDYRILTGRELKVTVGSKNQAASGDFYFALTKDQGKGLGDEGYLMDIGDSVSVEAETTTGAYWATRTILQSIKKTGGIPKGITRDYPLYKVRGFILDVGRKTFTLDYLKQIVQQMAWYKMNDLQVHLNDNLIPLEYYTNNGLDVFDAYSAFRLESNIVAGGNEGKNKADLTSKDLFYTKAEFRAFIKESRTYGVNIVPEIDTPAHSLALTKVRPDLRLGLSGRQNDHLDLKNQYEDCMEFVESIFDEYMKGSDPVFDEDTIVHVGADEYSADQQAYFNYSKDMLSYVKESGRSARIWGSLTPTRKGGVDTSLIKEVSENVQIDLWNGGYANIDEMYELGFDLINCNDGNYYIVPAAGYYYDRLGDGTLYNQDINSISEFKVPAGDKQMVGGAFAVWNDMTDYLENGISEYDVFRRVDNAIPLFGAKLWGKGALSLQQANTVREGLGNAPQTDFGYEVKSQGDAILNYTMDSEKDSSGNGYDLADGINAEIKSVEGRNVLCLNGGISYMNTPFKTVGLGNDLRVKVKRTSESDEEQILFESPYGTIKAVQKGTGRVGFSRENHDYSFDYRLPVNEWVELEFKNEQDVTELYVNGKLVDVLGDDDLAAEGKKLHATTMYPLERIGSDTNAFKGYIDDLRLGAVKDFHSAMELEYAVEVAEFIQRETRNDDLKAAIEACKDIFKEYDPAQEEIDVAIAQLKDTVDKTDYAKADYRRVDEYLKLVPDEERQSLFTEKSVARLKRAIDSIRRGLPVTKQDVVEGYADLLEEELGRLEQIPQRNVNYVDPAKLTVKASSYHAGENPERAIDNDPDTLWHSDYNITTCPHWFAFKIKGGANISGITYIPRANGGNGTLGEYEIQISTDDKALEDPAKQWTTIPNGSGNLEINEKTKEIIFDEIVETEYIRIVFNKTNGGFGSAAEIMLYDAGAKADIDGLQDILNEAKAIQRQYFTESSWTELQNAISEANGLLQSEQPKANQVEFSKRNLIERMGKLQIEESVKGVDKSALYSEFVAAGDVTEGDLDKADKTAADAYRRRLEELRDALFGNTLSQEAIDELTRQLKEAREQLVPKELPDGSDSGIVKTLEAPTIKSAIAAAYKKGVFVKVTVNKVAGADRYEIYRVTGNKAVKAGTVDKTGVFFDQKVTKENTKYYAVAISADGKVKSVAGAQVKAVFCKGTKKVAAKKTAGKIRVTWKKIKGAKKYVVYRSTGKNGKYAKVGTAKKNYFVDKKAKKGKKNYYKIAVVAKGKTSLMSKASKPVKR